LSLLPKLIDDEGALDDLLTTPSPELVESVREISGDVMILGVGGKMGPTLAVLLRRALNEAGSSARVIGVSRFSGSALRDNLHANGVETIACDLLDPAQLAKLPRTQTVIYLVGVKFGSTGNEAFTWAMNAYLPGAITQHFSGARIVGLSTGNVYPLTPVMQGGSKETDPVGPVGEYAQSCLGRERVFSYWAEKTGSPLTLIRLNYAAELRYGVLLDVAQKVASRQPVDLTMGNLNCIWQGDANSIAIRALEIASLPPTVLSLTGPETLSIRQIAKEFGELLGVEPLFTGEESPTALLSNASSCFRRFGYPRVDARHVMEWTAHWVKIGGPTLNKPTHFETRDGKF
jgi:nucleoside-diphosphate-sugar epimerase